MNFNPRTHRGVRHPVLEYASTCCNISIHAPIVGCDCQAKGTTPTFLEAFQSTHPSWGATARAFSKSSNQANFNPRTHRGVRHYKQYIFNVEKRFQSTHPSWGATGIVVTLRAQAHKFQSTHPSWGATKRDTN